MIEQQDPFDDLNISDDDSEGSILKEEVYICSLHCKIIEKICFHDQCNAKSILLCEDCDKLFIHEQDIHFNSNNLKDYQEVKKFIDELFEKRDKQFEQMEIILLTKLIALIELKKNSNEFFQQLMLLTSIWKQILAEKFFFRQNKYTHYLDLIFVNPEIKNVSQCYDRKNNIDYLENIIQKVNRGQTINIQQQQSNNLDKKLYMDRIEDLKTKIKFNIIQNSLFKKRRFDQQKYHISLLVLYLEIGKKYGSKESQKQVMEFVESNNYLKENQEKIFLKEYVLLNFNEGSLYKFNEQGEYFGFYYLRAITKANKKNYREALLDIQYALIQQSSCLEIIKLKTQMNINLQQYDNSERAAQQGLKLDPSFSQFYYYQGLSKFYQLQYDQAVELFKQAIGKEENELYYIKLGQTYQKLNLYEQALAIYCQAQEFYKQNKYKNKISDRNIFNVYSYKVDCLRQLRKFKEAKEICNLGLTENPNDYKLLNKKGQLYYDKEEYENAIQLFLLSINQKESAVAYLFLSLSYIENQQNDLGISNFQTFLNQKDINEDSKIQLIHQIQQKFNGSNVAYFEIIDLYNVKTPNDSDMIKLKEFMIEILKQIDNQF